MGKPIDFEGIKRMMEENPEDWYSPETAWLRFEGGLKRAMGKPLTAAERDALELGPINARD